MTFLIADDEPLIRKSLARALRARGYTDILEAEDGNVAVELWRTRQPDLVFLDVLMPHKTGPEVLAEMARYREGLRPARVILMSAYSGEFDLKNALALGAQLFIAKPFDDIFRVVSAAESLLGKS